MDRRLLRNLVPPRDRIGPDAGCDDARLLDRYGECRDERAFEELLTRYGPAVWGVCRRTLPRREDAEDAFQATFVALIRLAESGRRPRNLPGWLVKVAGRIGSNVRREAGRARRRQVVAARPESAADVPESSYDAYAAFREEVAALPDGLRAAYLVCELGGTPQPQACVQLGLKPSALSARLTRARQRLEARLAARGLAPAIAAVVLAGTATTLVAMPTRLVILAQSLCANPATIPVALSALASHGVTLMMTKLKLATLGLVALAATGLTLGAGAGLLPGAAAQAEKPAPTTAEATKPPAQAAPVPPADEVRPFSLTVMTRPAAKFEYRTHDLPATADELKKLLASEAVEGFELAAITPPATSGGASFTPLVIFKRPNPAAASGGAVQEVTFNSERFAVVAAERAAPDPRVGQLKEAREAVNAALKVCHGALKIGASITTIVEQAAKSLDGEPRVDEALAYLDALPALIQSELGSGDGGIKAAVLIATVKTKKLLRPAAPEADRPPPAVPVLPQSADPPLGTRPPATELAPRLDVPTLHARLPEPQLPSRAPSDESKPLEAEVARLKAELDQSRRDLEIQKRELEAQKAATPTVVRTVDPVAGNCTPAQGAKVVEALKALGVREVVVEPGEKDRVTLLIYNARPGDAELAASMIRTVTGEAGNKRMPPVGVPPLPKPLEPLRVIPNPTGGPPVPLPPPAPTNN